MCAKSTTPQPSIIPPDPNNFVVESRPPNVRFLSRAVQPPSNVYVEVSDVLVVGCASLIGPEEVTVSYRLLRYDGVVIHGQFVLEIPVVGMIVTRSEPLAEGFLLSVSCKATVATTRGRTFVRAFLTKIGLGPGQPSYMLMADYLTTAMAPAFPNGRILAPVEGPGFIGFNQPAPAIAGSDWVWSTAVNTRQKIISMSAIFTASGVAGNRFPGSICGPLGATLFQGFGEQAVTAGQTVNIGYSSTPNKPPVGNLLIWVPLPPDLVILPFMNLGSDTLGLQAGDQYTQMTVYSETWLDNV